VHVATAVTRMSNPVEGVEGQRPRLGLIALGALVAIGAPVAQILVAWLWSEGAISPDPNGPFVQALQFGFVLEWLLAPLGIYLIGVGYRLTTPARWIVLFALCSPVIAVLWILAMAALGGLPEHRSRPVLLCPVPRLTDRQGLRATGGRSPLARSAASAHGGLCRAPDARTAT
jgi:hypothetical protein